MRQSDEEMNVSNDHESDSADKSDSEEKEGLYEPDDRSESRSRPPSASFSAKGSTPGAARRSRGTGARFAD